MSVLDIRVATDIDTIVWDDDYPPIVKFTNSNGIEVFDENMHELEEVKNLIKALEKAIELKWVQ